MYGNGDCSEFNNCTGHGTCQSGYCLCDLGWTHADCSAELLCRYWDEDLGAWSSEGLQISPPPGGIPDGFLHCQSTHLTDFGGVLRIPMSLEELLAELTAIKFTFFTLDDMAAALLAFNPAENPTIFIMVVGSTLLDLIFICFLRWRYTRRQKTKLRSRAVGRRKTRDPEYEARRAEEKEKAKHDMQVRVQALLQCQRQRHAFVAAASSSSSSSAGLSAEVQMQMAALRIRQKANARSPDRKKAKLANVINILALEDKTKAEEQPPPPPAESKVLAASIRAQQQVKPAILAGGMADAAKLLSVTKRPVNQPGARRQQSLLELASACKSQGGSVAVDAEGGSTQQPSPEVASRALAAFATPNARRPTTNCSNRSGTRDGGGERGRSGGSSSGDSEPRPRRLEFNGIRRSARVSPFSSVAQPTPPASPPDEPQRYQGALPPSLLSPRSVQSAQQRQEQVQAVNITAAILQRQRVFTNQFSTRVIDLVEDTRGTDTESEASSARPTTAMQREEAAARKEAAAKHEARRRIEADIEARLAAQNQWKKCAKVTTVAMATGGGGRGSEAGPSLEAAAATTTKDDHLSRIKEAFRLLDGSTANAARLWRGRAAAQQSSTKQSSSSSTAIVVLAEQSPPPHHHHSPSDDDEGADGARPKRASWKTLKGAALKGSGLKGAGLKGAGLKDAGLPRASRLSSRLSSMGDKYGQEIYEAVKRRGFRGVAWLLLRKSWRALKYSMRNYIRTLQSEHTIVAAVAPSSDDTAGDRLHDENVVHIFFTTMISELAVLSMLSDADDDVPLLSLTTVINGLITTVVCSALASISKKIFRFGNRLRWRRRGKRRRRTLKAKLKALAHWLIGIACTGRRGGIERRRRGRKEKERRLKKKAEKEGGKGSKQSEEEEEDDDGPSNALVERLSQVGSKVVAVTKMNQLLEAVRIKIAAANEANKFITIPRRLRRARFILAWTSTILIYLAFCWFAITYAVLFSEAQFRTILLAWLAGLVFTWMIIEPLEILTIIMLPALSKNERIMACRDRCKDWGIYG